MKQTVLYVAKMDCPTEEQLIRNRLQAMEGVEAQHFNAGGAGYGDLIVAAGIAGITPTACGHRLFAACSLRNKEG